MQKNQKNEVIYYSFSNINTPHCFTTKHGGLSKGHTATMNLDTNKEESEIVMQNYRILCNILGFNYDSITRIPQWHTNLVVTVTESNIGNLVHKPNVLGAADALVTNIPNVTLVTLHADCLPLYFYDPIASCIGLAHAGWRGTISNIAKAVIQKMRLIYNTNPKNIIVGIGPGICQNCFEVNAPVANTFYENGPNKVYKYIKRNNNKYNINLSGVNTAFMLEYGIQKNNINVSNICTKCNSDMFYSHRLSGKNRGTMAAFMCL